MCVRSRKPCTTLANSTTFDEFPRTRRQQRPRVQLVSSLWRGLIEPMRKTLPGKDTRVIYASDYFFLQAPKGIATFAVDDGHVDIEDAEETVGHVFYP